MKGSPTHHYALAVEQNTTVGGTLAVTGEVSLSTSLKVANVNESVKREIIHVPFNGGAALADGVTYYATVPMARAGVIKKISISAVTRMAGGTNTLALAKKNGGTSVNLLSTTNVDPTAVPAAADTAEDLTLSGTPANLTFAAGDTLKGTLVCGTMTTDGVCYALLIEVEFTDV